MSIESKHNFHHGFILSESVFYAFTCQDVFPDVLTFAAARQVLCPEELERVLEDVRIRMPRRKGS